MDGHKIDQNVPNLWNVPNYVLSFLDADVVFTLNGTQCTRLNHWAWSAEYRASGYPIPWLSCKFKSFWLCTIYIRLLWLSEWLIALIPFFKSEDSVLIFFMGFYDWFFSIKKSGNSLRKKGRTIGYIYKSA